jgi:hypothetical protein
MGCGYFHVAKRGSVSSLSGQEKMLGDDAGCTQSGALVDTIPNA